MGVPNKKMEAWSTGVDLTTRFTLCTKTLTDDSVWVAICAAVLDLHFGVTVVTLCPSL